MHAARDSDRWAVSLHEVPPPSSHGQMHPSSAWPLSAASALSLGGAVSGQRCEVL